MPPHGLHHIAILCSDQESALRFYGALGFAVDKQYERAQWHDVVTMLKGNGFVIELFVHPGHPVRPSNPEAYGLRHVALRVENVARVCETLRAAGYEPEPIRQDSFTGEAMAFVKDPDGLPIELHE